MWVPGFRPARCLPHAAPTKCSMNKRTNEWGEDEPAGLADLLGQPLPLACAVPASPSQEATEYLRCPRVQVLPRKPGLTLSGEAGRRTPAHAPQQGTGRPPGPAWPPRCTQGSPTAVGRDGRCCWGPLFRLRQSVDWPRGADPGPQSGSDSCGDGMPPVGDPGMERVRSSHSDTGERLARLRQPLAELGPGLGFEQGRTG